MAQKTPLYDEHLADDAKMIHFAGWDMPMDYGSQIAEHKAVRDAAGMFDVSHMAVVDIRGTQARGFLRRVLANDVARIDDIGGALYSCMLNTTGGVVDDLIVYHLGENHYRAVVNAATTEKDMAWMKSVAGDFEVDITQRDDLAIIAVQGPQARERTAAVLDDDLAEAAMALDVFHATSTHAAADDTDGGTDGATRRDWSVGRTGYTGEDGFEIILPADKAVETWRALKSQDVQPAGLGARDTLRLEAGLNLYGQDMDEHVSPLVSGLAWTVALKDAERDFIGRGSIEDLKERGIEQKLVGLLLEGRGVMRQGAALRLPGEDESSDATGDDPARGEVTSGTFAPSLSRSIALARVPGDWQDKVEVQLRDGWQSARIVNYPFMRHGEIRIDL